MRGYLARSPRLLRRYEMSIQGWYYLHTNGSLIYKKDIITTMEAAAR